MPTSTDTGRRLPAGARSHSQRARPRHQPYGRAHRPRTASDDRGVHLAALLHFIHGVTGEEFDWDRRPFYLRFHPHDAADRAAAYAELCAELGIAT